MAKDSSAPRPEGDDVETDTAQKDVNEGDPISVLNQRWLKSYQTAAKDRSAELLDGAPGAQPDERLLIHIAAQDAAVADGLWESTVQLTARIGALVDDPKVVLLLATALQKVVSCRSATTRRVEECQLSVNTLRTQRRLTNLASIRRVA